MYEGFQVAISKIRQTFRDFIRKEKVEFPYYSLFVQNPGLLELVKEEKPIDETVNGFMKKIPINNFEEGQVEEIQLRHQDKAEKLKESLHNLHTIWAKDFKTLYPVWDDQSKISAKIKPILLPREVDGNLTPMQVLGKRMAPLKSNFLADSKESGLMSIFLSSFVPF